MVEPSVRTLQKLLIFIIKKIITGIKHSQNTLFRVENEIAVQHGTARNGHARNFSEGHRVTQQSNCTCTPTPAFKLLPIVSRILYNIFGIIWFLVEAYEVIVHGVN